MEQAILWWKFRDKDLYRHKNLQGIRKNGFQEAVGTASVRKIEKIGKNDWFLMIFADICMIHEENAMIKTNIRVKNLQGIQKSSSQETVGTLHNSSDKGSVKKKWELGCSFVNL